MGQSKILGISELAEAQVQAFQTVNDAVDALEKASNRVLQIDTIGLTEYIVNESDFTRYQVFVMNNTSSDVDFLVPATVNTILPNRVFSVINKGLHNITIKSADVTATDNVIITAGGGKTIYVDGISVNEISGGGGGGASGSTFTTIGVFVQGKPNIGDIVLQYTFADIVDFSVNFAGSQGSSAVAPVANSVFSVEKNGVAIGTITYTPAGASDFVAVGATTFNPGDHMTIIAPNPQDATLGDVSITLKGIRQ